MPTRRELERVRPFELTPWVRAVVDTTDLTLPPGYRIVGSARTPQGPFGFVLFRPSQRYERADAAVIERRSVAAPVDALGAVAAMIAVAWRHARPVVCVVCNRALSAEDDAMAITVPHGFGTGPLCSYCQDKHGVSGGYTVRVDADGWITSIEGDRDA